VPAGIILALTIAASGDWFGQGNEAYEAGDYQQAVALYDSAIARVAGGEAYFNRGNAYFKLGEVGRAIADYLRAYVLKPYDGDIRHNLEYCRMFRPDKKTTLKNPILAFLTASLRLLDMRLVRVLTGVLFLMTTGALAMVLIRAGPVWRWFTVGLGVLCVYGFASWMSWADMVNPKRAVVVVPEVALRSGPGEDYKEILVVHDGLEAIIRNRRSNYVLLQVPGGQGGWADTSAIEQVFPTR